MVPTARQYADAIRTSNAVVKNAAAALKVSRQAVYAAIQRHPTVKQAFDDAREDAIDYAETRLMDQIAAGNMTAIIFYLKTQAKHRGYIERQEVANSGDVTLRKAPQEMNADEVREELHARGIEVP